MEPSFARELIALNNRFYAEHAASFSATRSAPWAGWREVVRYARAAGVLAQRIRPEHHSDRLNAADARDTLPAQAPRSVRVLDLACGNLRFERFLHEEVPGASFTFDAIDRCAPLMTAGSISPSCHLIELDILEHLAANESFPLDTPTDLAVCFGFLHHVPTAELRERAVRALLDATRPGGIVALSYWRFMDDPRLARQAARTAERAAVRPPFPAFGPCELEPGDHLLGWQADPTAFRYCHHTSEDELNDLTRALEPLAGELARFSADGSTGSLNRYLILQRH